MTTQLHGHLDALDESRAYMSPQQQRIGIRRYLASKANVDVSDVVKLEIYGLNGCEPSTANRIFDALEEAQNSPIDNHEKFRLLQKTEREASMDRKFESMRRERAITEARCY